MLSTFSKWFGQLTKLRVKSITDTPFKFGFLALFLAFVEAIFSRYIPLLIIYVTFGFAGIFILPAWVAYFIALHKNPNLLRSEEYQLQRETFELIGDKQNPHPADPTQIQPTINKQIENFPTQENN